MTSNRRSRRRPPPLPEDDEQTSEVAPEQLPTDEFPAYDGSGGEDEEIAEDQSTSEAGHSPIQQELARRGLQSIDEEDEDGYDEAADEDGEEPTSVVEPEDLSDPGADEALVFGDDAPPPDDAGPTFVGSLPAVDQPEPAESAEKTEILAVPEEPPPEIPLLTVETPEGTSDVEVASDSFQIGRSPDCNVVIPDQLVSRNHAAIEKREDGFYIVDLESGNGTFLNEERVAESLLYDGDVIQVGDAVITFGAPGSEPPAAGRPPVEKTMMLDAAEVEEPGRGTSAGPIPKQGKRKKLFIIAGSLIVLIGILGIVKTVTKKRGPTPEEIAAQEAAAERERQQARIKRAEVTFAKVKELAKQENWAEARPLIYEVADVVPEDHMVQEYKKTITREDKASRALLDAKTKVAVDDFDGAISLLNTVPSDSMQHEKARELKKQLETKRMDFKLEAARKAIEEERYEEAVAKADEVLLALPGNDIAAALKREAEAKLNKPVPPRGKRKRHRRRRKRKIVKPTPSGPRYLLVGESLEAFRQGKVDQALAKAPVSGVSSEGVNQLRKFQKLYSRGNDLARNPGQASKAEAFLVQALKLGKKLGGKKGKIIGNMHSKLAKVYFVKGVDAHNRKKYPAAYKAYTNALKHRPDLKQASQRITTLEREARKLYETAYVIKLNQPDKAISHCKTVLQMVNSRAYAYGRCKKLLKKLRAPGTSSGMGEDDTF